MNVIFPFFVLGAEIAVQVFTEDNEGAGYTEFFTTLKVGAQGLALNLTVATNAEVRES